MHPIIPLFLACATLCLASPSPKTSLIATVTFAKGVRNFVHDDKSLPISDRLSGLNLSPCQSDNDCVGDRICTEFIDGEPVSCRRGEPCVCLPSPLSESLCSSESDCDEGESCVDQAGPFEAPGTLCVANDVLEIVDNIDEDEIEPDGSVCIGTHSLAHISRKDLVFEKDATAHVLCDSNDSCATPGHMVQYKGKGMMMRSYCEMAGCVRKVMRVNSPKYRRGLIVPSKTEDLVFTALAARFESRAEEGVLSAAVRLGF